VQLSIHSYTVLRARFVYLFIYYIIVQCGQSIGYMCSGNALVIKGAKYCNVHVHVCLSIRTDISETTCPKFTIFSVHVACGHCLWLSYGGVVIRYVLPDLWMTSCFPTMRHWGGATLPQQRGCGQPEHPCCVILVVSCLRRRQAPRLDESFVQGVMGRSLRRTIPCRGLQSEIRTASSSD